jgi:hypothetical protein
MVAWVAANVDRERRGQGCQAQGEKLKLPYRRPIVHLISALQQHRKRKSVLAQEHSFCSPTEERKKIHLMSWEIFGDSRVHNLVLPSLSSTSLLIHGPEHKGSEFALLLGSVNFEANTPTQVLLDFEIFCEERSLTHGLKNLFQIQDYEPSGEVELSQWKRQKTVNFQVYDRISFHSGLDEPSEHLNYRLVLTNNSTSSSIRLHFVNLTALVYSHHFLDGKRKSLSLGYRTSSPNEIIRIDHDSPYIIRLRANRVTPRDHVFIVCTLTVSNQIQQTYRPILDVNLHRDGKRLFMQSQNLVTVPSIIPGEMGPDNFIIGFTYLDSNVTPGIHQYSLHFHNRSVNQDGSATFLQVKDVNYSLLYSIPEQLPLKISENQSFIEGKNRILLAGETLDLKLSIPETQSKVIIQGILHIEIYQSTADIHLSLKRNNRIVSRSGVQVPFAAQQAPFKTMIPILLRDEPQKNIPLTYVLSLTNNSVATSSPSFVKIDYYSLLAFFI